MHLRMESQILHLHTFSLSPAAMLVQICFANRDRLARNCANEFPWHSWQEQNLRMHCISLNCLLQPIQKLYGFAGYQSCRSSVMASNEVCSSTNPVTPPDHLKLCSIHKQLIHLCSSIWLVQISSKNRVFQ